MTAIAPTSAAAPTLAPQAASDKEKLHKAAQAFEAIFVRQMLASAHSANFGNDLLSSQAGETFKSMQDENFARIASENGALGFAKVIEAQLARRINPPTASAPAPASTGKAD